RGVVRPSESAPAPSAWLGSQRRSGRWVSRATRALFPIAPGFHGRTALARREAALARCEWNSPRKPASRQALASAGPPGAPAIDTALLRCGAVPAVARPAFRNRRREELAPRWG